MPVPDLIRDSVIGQLIYHGSGRRLLQYTEERPEYIPRLQHETKPNPRLSGATAVSNALDNNEKNAERKENPDSAEAPKADTRRDVENGTYEHHSDLVVDWYGTDDPECPVNVSTSHLG